jgi:heme a synthase
MTSQELTDNSGQIPLNGAFLGVSTTIGVAGAVLMGVVSWVLLLVDRALPIWLILAISLVSFGFLTFLFLRNLQTQHLRVGATAGVIGGAISMIYLGSLMVVQPESLQGFESQANQFSAGGVAMAIGVVVLLGVFGAVAGKLLSGRRSYATKDIDWRSRFAWVVAASYLPLIVVGGLVTSTESGLAVPDSVTTYGAIGVLFPLSLMDEIRIYLEHSHRIFGTFAGIATIVLVVRMFGAPARMLPRFMSVLLLLAVIAQGVMGALRVSEESQALAALHGVLAQLVFALAISTGVVSSRRWESIVASNDGIDSAKSTRLMLLIAAIGLTIQLVFGSMTRHLDSGHALMSHVGFSFIVVVLVIIAGAKCIRLGKIDDGVRLLRRYGVFVHGLVMLQFTLGWGALAMTRNGEEGHPTLPTSTQLDTAGGIRVAETLITSSHHVIGALLIAAIFGALMWTFRIASRPKS